MTLTNFSWVHMAVHKAFLHSPKTFYYDHRHFYAGQTPSAYKVSVEGMFSYQMQWNTARFFIKKLEGP